jgi:hypothetical protein
MASSDKEKSGDGGGLFLVFLAAAMLMVVGVITFIQYTGAVAERERLIKQAATVGTARYVIDPVTGASKAVWVLPNGATEDIK